MEYYQLMPNPTNKKWKGYEVVANDLWSNNDELSAVALRQMYQKWDFDDLEYRNLIDGKIPSINHVGSNLLMFSSEIPHIESINMQGLQLVPVINKTTFRKYYLVNVYMQVDCVDWEKSEVDRWLDGHNFADWHNRRGRFFINPVLNRVSIPSNLDIFRLQEWGGAFNIIISERMKERIFELDFDKSFLEFKLLSVV